MKSKLYLYFLLHANLKFSSIPSAHYSYIIENCYLPIIHLLTQFKKLKLTLEAPAETWEIIKQIKPKLIKTIKKYSQEKRVELVGSGYSQIIGPLVPAKVNLWNLQIGNQAYKKILGQTPKIAYINEQCFSQSLIDIYHQAGFKALILDIDNTTQASRLGSESAYQIRLSDDKFTHSQLFIIWSSSILFQQLQKYIFAETNLDNYLKNIYSHIPKKGVHYLGLYGNDWEIFNYRPGDNSYVFGLKQSSEIRRLKRMFSQLLANKSIVFATPQEILKRLATKDKVSLTTAQMPVMVKKQPKYNLSRWAVCGREATKMNRQCFRLYNIIKNKPSPIYQKQLLKLWGSDYRTHTTEEKYFHFRNKMGHYLYPYLSYLPYHQFDIAKPPCNKVKNLKENSQTIHIKTKTVILQLNKLRGGTIISLTFPQIDPSPLIGTLAHGFFKQIKLSPDWYSAHTIIFDRSARKITDLQPIKQISVWQNSANIKISMPIQLSCGQLFKIYTISKDKAQIKLQYHFNLDGLSVAVFRLGIITLIPSTFNRNSLSYQTHLGGFKPEKHCLSNTFINQDEALSLNISSRGCLGATKGFVEIGDKDKAVKISANYQNAYCTYLLHHEETGQSYLTRIIPTIAELDDTSANFYRGHIQQSFTITGVKK